MELIALSFVGAVAVLIGHGSIVIGQQVFGG